MHRLFFILLFLSFSVSFPVLSETVKMVRMEIAESGFYEISFDKLKDLGYENPYQVGISANGEALPILSDGKRIIFYALGPENISFQNNVFVNNGPDIYSFTRSYFLTDNPDHIFLMKDDNGVSADSKLTTLVSYVCHERDLEQNSTSTGQLFWGERFNRGESSRKTWNINISSPSPDYRHSLNCRFYFPYDDKGEIGIGTSADPFLTRVKTASYKSTYLKPLNVSAYVQLSNGDNEVIIDYDSPANVGDYANLDFWILNYAVEAPDNVDSFPKVIACPDILPGSSASLSLPVESLLLLDISDPFSPINLPLANSGEGWETIVTNHGSTPVIAVKDLSEPFLTPSLFISDNYSFTSEEFNNLLKEGADLLIVTPEWLLDKGLEFARFHKEKDEISSVVISSREVYNRYSGGQPSPEAIRLLAADLKRSPGRELKNILLMGPFLSDVRGMAHPIDSERVLIAPQHENVIIDRGAYPKFDYYGAVSLAPGKSLENAEISVGVGILPFNSTAEADMYLSKLEKFYSNPAVARTLADMLWVGGVGDSHTHDRMAVDLADESSALWENNLLNSVIAIDAYGSEAASGLLIEKINSGKNLFTYIGHSGPSRLGGNGKFFSTADLRRLNNSSYPFFIIAGCNGTYTDKGFRGIAEHLVVSTPFGCIGSLASTRETWAGQNFSFAKLFLSQLANAAEYADGNVPTIGEIYSRLKTECKLANELAYLLVCDPAIKIPVPSRAIDAGDVKIARAGDNISLKARVLDRDGKHDTSFSGSFCVRLVAPGVELPSQDLETGPLPEDDDPLIVTYDDRVITISEGKVTNGKFECQIPVPATIEDYDNETGSLLLTAYDNNRRLGASFRSPVVFTADEKIESSSFSTPPAIESISYDADTNSILISAHDDRGISASSPFRFILDNKKIAVGAGSATGISNDAKSCVYTLPLPTLSAGMHTLEATVFDIDGNRASESFVFSIGDVQHSLGLSIEEEAITSQCNFSFSNLSSGEVKLIILDAAGKVVFHTGVSGSSFRWDVRNGSGQKVSPGVYKAFITQSDSSGFSHCSGMVYLPVL